MNKNEKLTEFTNLVHMDLTKEMEEIRYTHSRVKGGGKITSIAPICKCSSISNSEGRISGGKNKVG